ncbi:hypothetical protein [Azohydromonas lata]|uniref:Uncharacterized protein n=1 Tax=Azohydromonas lata TaxID=45677 RepID=A0ABU5ICI8_9BURK|nr:hypothetical protein [Azohydromonas lata]MDZ5456826.1 hypothetical protein [Azohydromonas lata]
MTPDDLRAHFAAHAPDDIPSWFQPAVVEPSLPSLPERGSDDTADNAAVKAWSDQRSQAHLRREQYRYFAWRWYYADQMVALKDMPISLQPHG